VKRLYSAGSLPEAYLLRDRLAQAGIDARVFNENAQGGLGEIPFTHAYPEVWLMEPRDEARARAIVRDIESPPFGGVEKRCAACGEANPGNFEVCWHCGSPI
jgi:hypothetical protein